MVWEVVLFFLCFFFFKVESFIQNKSSSRNSTYLSSFIQLTNIYCAPSIVQSTRDLAVNTINIKPPTSWNLEFKSAVMNGYIWAGRGKGNGPRGSSLCLRVLWNICVTAGPTSPLSSSICFCRSQERKSEFSTGTPKDLMQVIQTTLWETPP